MMMDEPARPPSSSSSEKNNVPPPEPDPPPNENNPGSRSNLVSMSSQSPSQVSQPQQTRSRAQSSGTSEENQSSPNSSSTPPWLRWSRGLNSLLDDPPGREVFERYLHEEGCSAQLNFIWACEGLKETAVEDPPKIPPLIRSIYKHFFQNNALLGISEEARSELTSAIKDGIHEVTIFDKTEDDVRTHMEDNLYPNFLKSEIYLSAVNGEEENSSHLVEHLDPPPPEAGSISSGRKSSSGDGSGDNGGGEQKACLESLTIDVDMKCGSEGQSPKIPSPPLPNIPAPNDLLLINQLQTVHEDKELNVNQNSKLKLTKEALHMTQRTRAIVPVAGASTSKLIRTRESYASHVHKKACTSSTAAPHPYHASYASYNPVSRVDSEIQSMSSDAMTDDGAHSGHGHSSGRKHPHHHQKSKSHQQITSSHPQLHQSLHSSGDPRRRMGIPQMHLDNRDNLPECPAGIVRGPTGRAPIKGEQDVKTFAALLIRKLEVVKREREKDDQLRERMPEFNPRMPDHGVIGGASGGRMEPSTQNVLAAAINKIQIQDDDLPGDILDKHVSRVFSDNTPNAKSPNLRSPTAGLRRGGPCIPGRQRKERDVISTFSGDSGNIHDFCESMPSMTRSRSTPSEMRIRDHGDFPPIGVIGAPQHGRFIRAGVPGYGCSRNVPISLTTKRTSSEFLDSGISVVSGATPTVVSANQPPPPLPCERTDLRVQQWMERCEEVPTRSATSPSQPRRSKKPVCSVPLPPTPTLEEVRRRLTKKPAPLPSVVVASQSTQVPIGPVSSSSSCGNPLRHQSPPSSDESSSATSKEHCLSSIVTYEDTPVPYSLKIPCKLPIKPEGISSPSCGITLAVFKEHLPKRGNYRYFFYRECAEVPAGVVLEEIIDDFQELPLHQGKIIAKLQSSSMSATASVSDKI